MKKIIVILILLLFLSFPVCANDQSFCDDTNIWDRFNAMVEKNPNDIPLQILHALKIGLCVKIEANSITTTEAMNLFNDMVDTVANKRGEQEEVGKKEDL
jgi:hypothetical protein